MNKIKSSDKEYSLFLKNIIREIGNVKVSVARVINTELTGLYFVIGKMILEKQKTEGWGESVIEKLSRDIEKKTGITTGFSPRNLWFMKQFYEEYSDGTFLKQLVSELKLKQPVSELRSKQSGQELKLKQPVSELKNNHAVLGLLPWGHHILLMQKTKKNEERIYYITAAAQSGWSRKVLLNQIKANAYRRHRQLPKHHNFKKALPAHLQEQADEMIKSEYNLQFLGISKPVHERDFEKRLLEKLKHFVLELGYGFSFIGSQYRLELNRKEHFVDLLFFQRNLRCLVAIDLKIGDFEPEFAGKMNFYLNLLDDKVRLADENPSIGIILCAEKNSVEVEYALKGINKPIAVSGYQLEKSIPKILQKQLPSAKELAAFIKTEFKNDTLQ
jgi:predicted nuclease of restriction endonuclease-like (RecB) superfamily